MQGSRLSSAISALVVCSERIWVQECLEQDAAGSVQGDLVSSSPAMSQSLNEICLTKAFGNVTMVQFFFWKLTQLRDQLHSTGEIKGCRDGRGFTTFKPQTHNRQPKGCSEERRAKEAKPSFLLGFN